MQSSPNSTDNPTIDHGRGLTPDEFNALMNSLTDPATKRLSPALIDALSNHAKSLVVGYLIAQRKPIIAEFVTDVTKADLAAANYSNGYHNDCFNYWLRPEQRGGFQCGHPEEPVAPERTVHVEPGDDLDAAWEQMQQEKTSNTSNEQIPSNDDSRFNDQEYRNTGNAPPNDTKPPSPDYAAMGEALRIRPDEDIPPPPVCLSIQQGGQNSTFGTLGNFSVLIGKAKSRKTFTAIIAIAAALVRDVVLKLFAGAFDDDKRTVLYFDTEQGRYHVLKVVKRICRLANQPAPAHLLVYSLRSLTTKQRLGFIEWHIYHTPNVGLVVIDGIRDTVNDINDNAEATERVGDLLRWTEQRNIHILTVIHMNKGNDQIRGSIGTELQNKAETVVSVAVDPTNKDISIVTAEYCRDKEFEPFAFCINEQGLPVLVADWQPEQRGSSNRNKVDEPAKGPRSVTPGQLTTEQHEGILRRAFAAVAPDRYKETCHRIKAAAEYFGHKFGESRAKEFVTYYTDKGLLQKVGQTYALKLTPEETPDFAPEESGLV